VDQQYATAADAQIAGRHAPSPAQLSPSRVKRARRVMGACRNFSFLLTAQVAN
jgi:hypothetical protein